MCTLPLMSALRAELNLVPLAFLWQRNQSSLLDEMVASGFVAILIKVAGIGLVERDLGKTLNQLQPKLEHLHSLYDAHVCGEGGEYETLSLDAPIFSHRVNVIATESVLHSDAAFASVSYLRILDAQLAEKNADEYGDQAVRRLIHAPPLMDPLSLAIAEDITQSCGSNERDSCIEVTPRTPSVRRTPTHITISGISAHTTGSFIDEATAAFHVLQDTLSDCGLAFHDVSHVNIYLASAADFASLNRVYSTHFGVSPPSRVTVAVPMSGVRIVMDIVASHDDRRALHVQSRSYWAPASIGPYSQASKVGSRTTIAGQIGLVPATMQLVADPIEQAVLALQHTRRIVLATREWNYSQREGYVEGGICWVSRDLHAVIANIWNAQPDVDETHAHHHLDDATWRGTAESPLLVVQVQPGGLPRDAAAEWQLTTNSGRTGDPEEEYKEPGGTERGTCIFNDVAVTYWMSSNCGAAIISRIEEGEQGGDARKLVNALDNASHVRQFHAGDALLERVCTPHALTNIPAHAWSLPGYTPTSSGSAVFWLAQL